MLSAVDASAWSEAKLRLIRSEEIHRSLVEECPFGIYRYNLTTSRYEEANAQFLQLLGYSLDELCSERELSLYVDAADHDRYLAELHACGKVRDFESCLRKKDAAFSTSPYPDISVSTLRAGSGAFSATCGTLPVSASLRSIFFKRTGWKWWAVWLAASPTTSTTLLSPSVSPANLRCCKTSWLQPWNRNSRTYVARPCARPRSPANCWPSAAARFCNPAWSISTIAFVCPRHAQRSVGSEVAIALELDESVEAIFIDPTS